MKLFQLTAFGLAAALITRLLPKHTRWILLLGVSLLFYGARSLAGLPLILITALTTWGAALLVSRIAAQGKLTKEDRQRMTQAEQKAHRKRVKQRRNRITGAALILNFLLLGVFKYADQILGLAGQSPLGFLLPLGISFYTFQSAGYLFDVNGGKIEAERNPLRYLLFVSFFPQLIQGPIGRFDALAPQLRDPEDLTLTRFVRGMYLVLWGLIKKMVIADRCVPFISAVFDAPAGTYGSGLSALALLLYAIQQYCDFSGGIDLVIGIAEWLGVSLSQNFRRPYFAVSLGDFWRRWHITLGSWMRDYVFYPFALCKPVNRLGKAVGRHNEALTRTLPAALGNLLVFFLVGLWHGAASNYILWGLYNGVILAVSAILEPLYKAHPLPKGKAFTVLRILRTFIIVNIGWLFDRCASGAAALSMLRTILFDHRAYEPMLPILDDAGLPWPDRLVLIVTTALLFAASLCAERGIVLRDRLTDKPFPVRWLILLAGICAVVLFGIWGSGFNEASFIYLNF